MSKRALSVGLVIGVLLTPAFISSSHAQLRIWCTRHIYNKSSKIWTYEVGNNAKIECVAPSGKIVKNKSGKDECQVMPGAGVTKGMPSIAYKIWGDYWVFITDYTGKFKRFGADPDSIMWRPGMCPRTGHKNTVTRRVEGNTGGTSLNSPADSDFTSSKDTW